MFVPLRSVYNGGVGVFQWRNNVDSQKEKMMSCRRLSCVVFQEGNQRVKWLRWSGQRKSEIILSFSWIISLSSKTTAESVWFGKVIFCLSRSICEPFGCIVYEIIQTKIDSSRVNFFSLLPNSKGLLTL